MKHFRLTLAALGLLSLSLSACSSFLGNGFDNQESYQITVIDQATGQPVPDAEVQFWAYFTGTFGRAYLLQDQQPTDASGTASFALEYDDDTAQTLRDSVDSATEGIVFQIDMPGKLIVMDISDAAGASYPPVIINRELPLNASLTYTVRKLAVLQFQMQDTLNPSLYDEVRFFWRELDAVAGTALDGLNTYQEDISAEPQLWVAADREVELRWEAYEGPDPNNLTLVSTHLDTVNVAFGTTLDYPIIH